MHEDLDYYLHCKYRERNKGLFTADQVNHTGLVHLDAFVWRRSRRLLFYIRNYHCNFTLMWDMRIPLMADSIHIECRWSSDWLIWASYVCHCFGDYLKLAICYWGGLVFFPPQNSIVPFNQSLKLPLISSKMWGYGDLINT